MPHGYLTPNVPRSALTVSPPLSATGGWIHCDPLVLPPQKRGTCFQLHPVQGMTHRFFSQTDGAGLPGALSTDSASRRAHAMLGEVVGSQEPGTIKEVNHHVTPRRQAASRNPLFLSQGAFGDKPRERERSGTRAYPAPSSRNAPHL